MRIHEAVERARAAGYPLVFISPMRSGLWAANLAYAWRAEKAEARLRTLCAAIDVDPTPFIAAAAGNPYVMEAEGDRIARFGSRAALTNLADALADA